MRPIDADKMKNFFKGNNEAVKFFHTLIDAQPTIDVAPVVHAHWEYDPNGMDWNMGAWRCSKCKERNNNLGGDEKINPLLFAGSSYCPSCGAKMDESVE